MKQVFFKKGHVYVDDVPPPVVSDGNVLVRVAFSCISAGTELSGIASSGTPLLKRLMEQPDKITKWAQLVRSEGLKKTIKKTREQLDEGKPIGYSLSGVVIGVGKNVKHFKIGDRIAAAGGGYANHAEYAEVPENLVVRIPEGLHFREASTLTLGAIALQGVRRADLRLGEYCVVMGTGILGLITIQLLRISGIRVIAIDPDKQRRELAALFGAELILDPGSANVVGEVINYTRGYGSDAVLFTAATSSNDPLSQSFQMCKKKGKVILVGVSGMQIDRKDIYPKELDFLISTSYGPGRYDREYEEKGLDYPYAYVRWTENRNLGEYLRLLASGLLDISPMLHAVYPVDKAPEAYDSLSSTSTKPLIVLLDYGIPEKTDSTLFQTGKNRITTNIKKSHQGALNIALVGAGSFATTIHLPNMEGMKNMFSLQAVVDKTGNKAKTVASRYGAAYASADVEEMLKDGNIDLVFITTRHDSHGSMTMSCLEAGKHVFVEKPLATRMDEINKIADFYLKETSSPKPVLTVGFNRRFSPYAREIKKHTDQRTGPVFIHYRMNAGYIPEEHWVHESGGRIVGEACHIIDLVSFLIHRNIDSMSFESLSPISGKFKSSDNKSIILKYTDGSLATIEYFAVGSRQFPKEYMEVHFDEKTIVMDDYKTLKGYGCKIKEISTKGSEKGHREELVALYNSISGQNEQWPIPLEQLIETTKATLIISEL